MEKIDSLKINDNFYIHIIDDGSYKNTSLGKTIEKNKYSKNIQKIFTIQFTENLGLNTAICSGLKSAFKKSQKNDYFIVMDSDGEDNPEDIIRLRNFLSKDNAVVAQRIGSRRSLSFSLWLLIFRIIVKSTTNKKINFGNFSLLSFDFTKNLLTKKSLSVSYVGTLLKQDEKIIRIPTKRGTRYFGATTSGRKGQFKFGFDIMSVFLDMIILKIFYYSFVFFLLSIFSISILVVLKFFTNLLILGWAGIMITIIITSSIQVIMISAILSMFITRFKS